MEGDHTDKKMLNRGPHQKNFLKKVIVIFCLRYLEHAHAHTYTRTNTHPPTHILTRKNKKKHIYEHIIKYEYGSHLFSYFSNISYNVIDLILT